MRSAILESAKKLGKAGRILLVEELWDSIAAEPDDLQLTSAQQMELEKRLADLEKHGSRGADWQTVKKRILGKHR